MNTASSLKNKRLHLSETWVSHQSSHYTHFLKEQIFRRSQKVKSDSALYSRDMLNQVF